MLAGGPVRRSDLVRWAELGDTTILLNVADGRYRLLNRTAAAIWAEVEGVTAASDLESRVARRLRVPVADAALQVERFVADAIRNGILSPADRAPSFTRHSPRRTGRFRWGLVKAVWAIARVRLHLRLRKFSATYLGIAQTSPTGMVPPQPSCLARAEQQFLLAENLFPVPRRLDDCLPRSLALFSFLKSMGLPARHRIGVRAAPLLMHAWVESGGRIVLDDARCRDFKVLSELE